MRVILTPLLDRGIVAGLVLAVLITEGIPRLNGSSDEVVYASELVPFEDLFAPEDTLVLDPSVPLGDIFFMDVDTDGSILVTEFQSELAHLFAPTGKRQTSYRMETCYPSDFGYRPWTSRFADDDRIILTTLQGVIVIFDRSGNCVAAKKKVATIMSFCTLGDSVYTFRWPTELGPSTSIMDVYSLDLESSREIVLEAPEYYRLNSIHRGIPGREVDYFGNHIHRYPESLKISLNQLMANNHLSFIAG